MIDQVVTVDSMASKEVTHGPDTLDHHVWREIEVQMVFVTMERLQAGVKRPTFTLVELGKATGLSEDQIGRRKAGRTGLTLDDVYIIAEALGVEPFALVKAGAMRMRQELGLQPKRLRDQVIEGPAGLPTIQ